MIRDLEKCKNNTCHEWCKKFKSLVQKIIHDRNELISIDETIESFDIEYINNFDSQYEDILYNAIEENLNKILLFAKEKIGNKKFLIKIYFY